MPAPETTVGQLLEPDSLSTETLQQALSHIKERISRVATQIGELQRLMTMAKEEEKLLERLLAIRSGSNLSQQFPTIGSDDDTLIAEQEQQNRDTRSPIVVEVLRVLGEAARPLHISELMRILKERATPIPGAGTQANLIVHMSRDPRIVRPSRGMYALAAWGLAAEARPARRRSKRRRKKQKTS